MVEGRAVEQDIIPYVGQLELATIPFEAMIINPDVHGLLCSCCDVAHLPTHYGEVVDTDVMTSDFGIVIDGGRSIMVFHKPFLKGPCRFLCVLLIIIKFVTLIFVDYSTFLCDVVPILGDY